MVERFEMYAGITKRLGGGGVPIRKYALSPALAETILPPGKFDQELMAICNKHIRAAMVHGAKLAYTSLRRRIRERTQAVQKDVLIDVPPDVYASIDATMDTTFAQPYWAHVGGVTRETVRATLETGIAQHQGSRSLATSLRQVSGLSDVRARRIARTELTTAMNSGHYAVSTSRDMQEAGVSGREWMSVGDRETRKTHLRAHGQRVGVRQPFRLGASQCRFPGDPNLPAGERINCRCTTLDLFSDEFTPGDGGEPV